MIETSNDIEKQRALALVDYREHGVGLLRGLIPRAWVKALLEESDRLWEVFQTQGAANLRIGIRTEPSGKVVLERLDPVVDISPVFEKVNKYRDLVSLAEAGLCAPVTTMKEKLSYKWPGTPGFGLHRDGDYNTRRTGVPGREAMTVCVALDPVTRANGPIEFFPGLRFRSAPAPVDEPRDIDENIIRGLEPVCPELEPGDAVLFDGLVPHRSDRNTSDHPRRLYMITYVPARYTDARERYYAARVEEQAAQRHALLAPIEG